MSLNSLIISSNLDNIPMYYAGTDIYKCYILLTL